MAKDADGQTPEKGHEPNPSSGLGTLFDALIQTIDPEDKTFLERFDEHLEQEYRKLEDTPGDHEDVFAFLLEAHEYVRISKRDYGALSP